MIPETFKRTALLVGEPLFTKLQHSHVTVIGLGAVGYHAAEAMVRFGIGTIRLVDFDLIHPGNLNRQLLALHSTLGHSKIKTAQSRLLDINPQLNIELFETFFHEESYPDIFKNPTDIVVDAIDSFTPKVTLLEKLTRHHIPVISSMGAALKTDPAAIRTGDISETHTCPLASRIRKKLRQSGIQSGIRCVYSIEPPFPHATPSPIPEKEFYERGRKRNPVGSISFVTGIFGYTIASEVFKHLTR
jgi:tRNA threonylcarbamoyladenosine dehydratase